MKKGILLSVSICILLCIQNLGVSQQSLVGDTTSKAAPKPIDVIDINYEIEKVNKTLKKTENEIGLSSRFFQIKSEFEKYRLFLENEADEFKTYNPFNLSKYFLESTHRSWGGFLLKLSGWQSEVNNMVKSTQNKITDVDKIHKVWKLTLDSEEFASEPQEFKSRVRETIQKTEIISNKIKNQKRQYMLLEDEISDLASFCDGIIEQVLALQQNQLDSLLISESPVLWKVKIKKSDVSPVLTRLNKSRHENAKTIKNYIRTTNLNSIWFAAIVIFILFYTIRYRYVRLNFDDSEPGNKTIARIMISHPWLSLFTLIVTAIHFLFPYKPLLTSHIITVILLINMWYILSGFVNPTGRSLILRIIILSLVNNLEIVFWYFGHLANYFIQFESILGIILMYPFLKLIYWRNFKSNKAEQKGFLLLGLSSFTLFLISFFANLLGFLDLAVLFVKAGILVPGLTIILFGLYKILMVIIITLIKIGKAGKNRLLDNYWSILEKRSIQTLYTVAIFYWFFLMTVSFEVTSVVFDGISDFFLKERSVGTLDMTIGGIFALIIILLVTFILTSLIKVVIEDVIFKGSTLPRGVAAAISVTIRYFLIVLGFLFALSSAGIELGKFSLLAGALGVGIGFGLQNIVNNFISGLILVYERPIQIGDTIEVESLLGQVNRIGVRSSNVRTYDGAEVVVPNGNLISNQLINWTLSDNKRRIDFRIGVSYGSDPNQVIEILEKVAQENNDTLKDPAPRALFDEFGESSLNFRLLFWVPYDIGLGTKSDVAIAIFNKFKEHKIEIPFPQVDLHVKEGNVSSSSNAGIQE
ncbi:MAG: mechanosensitive ion channel [Bacteroidales bacterium]